MNPGNLTPRQAIELQLKLRPLIRLTPLPKQPSLIAGMDISYNRYSPTHVAVAVVFKFPSLEKVDEAHEIQHVSFPYIPGLLSFRELPLLVSVYEKLRVKPDLIFCDGQGIAHPRRLGIATHLGLVLQAPTIGVAKKCLCGKYVLPPEERGAVTPLVHDLEKIGEVLRTKAKAKPVFVSPGHLITQEEATNLTLACTQTQRIPLPTREAHRYANECRVKHLSLQKNPPGSLHNERDTHLAQGS